MWTSTEEADTACKEFKQELVRHSAHKAEAAKAKVPGRPKKKMKPDPDKVRLPPRQEPVDALPVSEARLFCQRVLNVPSPSGTIAGESGMSPMVASVAPGCLGARSPALRSAQSGPGIAQGCMEQGLALTSGSARRAMQWVCERKEEMSVDTASVQCVAPHGAVNISMCIFCHGVGKNIYE